MCFVPGVCFLCFLPLCLLQSCLCSPDLYPGLDFCFCIFLYSLSVLSPAFNLLLHFVLQLMLSFCIRFLLAKTHNNITTVHVFFFWNKVLRWCTRRCVTGCVRARSPGAPPHQAALDTPAAASPTDSWCWGSSSCSWPVWNTPAPPCAYTWTSLSPTSKTHTETQRKQYQSS